MFIAVKKAFPSHLMEKSGMLRYAARKGKTRITIVYNADTGVGKVKVKWSKNPENKKHRVVIKKCCPQKEGQHMAGPSIRAILSNSGSYDITSENIKEIITEAVAGRSKQGGIL